MVGGALLLGFALIPGFPTLTFMALAGAIGGGGYFLMKKVERARSAEEDGGIPAMAAATESPSEAKSRLDQQEEFTQTLPLIIDVPNSVQKTLNAASLNEELLKVRKSLYMDLGVPFPGIHLRFNDAHGRKYLQHTSAGSPRCIGLFQTRLAVRARK